MVDVLPIAIGQLKALRREALKLWAERECLFAELKKRGCSVRQLGNLLDSAAANPSLQEQAKSAVGFHEVIEMLEEVDRENEWAELEARPQEEIDAAVRPLLDVDYRKEFPAS